MLNRETIQKRSYSIWEQEGRPHGRHHEHWKRAENELIVELERLHQEASAVVEAATAPKPAKAAKSSSKAKAAKTQAAAPRKRKTKDAQAAE